MQGINQSKHQHLVDALLHLEILLTKDFMQEADSQQAIEYRIELQAKQAEYEQLLSQLAEVIVGYEELFSKVKMQFLSPKLKELRKRIPQDGPVFLPLVENIRLAYGT